MTNTLISNLEYPISKTYDAAERISSISGGSTASATFAYAYNTNNGLASRVTYPNGMVQSNVFDVMDRIIGIEYYNTTGLVSSFSYAYNDAGMITNRTTEDRGQTTVVSYAYDSVDQLIQALSVSSVTSLWEYSYDLAGNRTNWLADGTTNVSTFASGNRMTGWGGGSSIGYDSAGNMTQIVNRAGVTNSLVWNARYQLTEVRTNSALAESYGYDALGRRAWISDGTTTNYLVYDGLHVIAETDADGQLKKQYITGPGVDNWLGMVTYDAGTTNRYYFIKDHIGSVTAITDTNGAIVESYTFDAFGNVLGVYDSSNQPISESAIGNHYLHQGRLYSWETGYYYHRARWRNPETGTWLSKDPIGIAGGLNQYVFCRNNPVNYIDPDGLIASGPEEGASRIKIKWAGGGAISYDVKSISELANSLKSQGKMISSIQIEGHGNVIGRDFIRNNISTLATALKPYMANDSEIYFDQCESAGYKYSTKETRKQSIAAEVSKLLGNNVTVIGNVGNAWGWPGTGPIFKRKIKFVSGMEVVH